VYGDAVDTTVRERYEQAMATREQVSFESFYEPTSTWFEVTVYPDDDGVSVYFTDVTDRRERERELERYEDVVAAVDDVVYALDDRGRFELVNETITDLTGYTQAELLGEHVGIIKTDEIVAAAEDSLRSLLNGEAGQTTFEFPLQHKQGTTVPCEDHMTVLYDDDGGFAGTAGVIRDVSEQQERERELERQNARLERFASTVSHDLRNPLKMAASNLQMAQHEVESDLLDDVAAAHERMAELIEDLLALARQGQAVDETEPLSVAAVAVEAWDHIDAPEATLRVDSDETVDADRQRLLQAFENLFRNAVEHAGDDVTIRVYPTDEGFVVADDGPGIPDDEREAVFEYGYTTTATGTGLGLAIVQEVLNAHGWEIALSESAAGGARFDVLV
jgi:PAS domain S-box-containing protein